MTLKQKTALVLGGGGFIGNAMVTRLKSENYWVRSVDLKSPEYSTSEADAFVEGDLRNIEFVESVIRLPGSQNQTDTFDEIYQFAAERERNSSKEISNVL